MADDRPLALVLTGGGARAAYQVGVLSGIAERSGGDVRFPIVTGVSAGAINAAGIAGGCRPFAEVVDGLAGMWRGLSVEQVFRAGVPSLGKSMLKWLWTLGTGGLSPGYELQGLLDTRPLERMLTRFCDPEGIEDNLASGRLRSFAVSATSYATGQTVTFVQGQDEPPAWRRAGRRSEPGPISARHVLASCALPLLFPAVRVDGEWYGDGSIRQTAPLAPAIHLGAGRILAISLRHRAPAFPPERHDEGLPPPAQVLGMLFNAVFLDALEADAERLQRINRSLRLLPAGSGHPEGLRPLRLEVLRPSRDLGELARDLFDSLPGSLRVLVRGLGSERLETPDFLSYLLFERPYAERLLELGRSDAIRAWPRLVPLFEGAPTGRTRGLDPAPRG